MLAQGSPPPGEKEKELHYQDGEEMEGWMGGERERDGREIEGYVCV